jgi:hypothetical protein
MTEVRVAADAASEDLDLAELRRIVLRVLGGPIATVYLFGSFATGGRHRASDIDLALEAPAGLSRRLLAKLRDEIEESHIPYRVDVVDLAETDDSFRERVKRTGKVWIERASG